METIPPNKNRDAQEKLITDIRSRRDRYTTMVSGREFIVLPDVFSPEYVLDTEFFANNLPDQKGKDVLEVGPGTGVISITAALQGATHVTAVDINPAAVQNTLENAKKHDVQEVVSAYESDIFQNIPEGQTFDTILWNIPWGDFGHGEQLDMVQKAFYDPGYQLLRRFISGASAHLRKGGQYLSAIRPVSGAQRK